jgi:hypothetical protein
MNRFVEFHFNAYHNYSEIVFFEEILSQKGGITQIKCWMELSSLVNKASVGGALVFKELYTTGLFYKSISKFQIFNCNRGKILRISAGFTSYCSKFITTSC